MQLLALLFPKIRAIYVAMGLRQNSFTALDVLSQVQNVFCVVLSESRKGNAPN